MTKEGLRDHARGSGLIYNKFGKELCKSELEEHILEAQTFAAALRAQHPSSCERGASARGDWWGFPGDYEVLDSVDLTTEATYAGLPLSHYNQYAPISFLLWVPNFLTLELSFSLDIGVAAHR